MVNQKAYKTDGFLITPPCKGLDTRLRGYDRYLPLRGEPCPSFPRRRESRKKYENKNKFHDKNGLISAFIVMLLYVFCPFPAFAGQIAVSLSLDRTTVQIGDAFAMTVQVSGTRTKPQIPGIKNFSARGTGTSSRHSFSNGQIRSSVEYTYQLIAKKEGAFTLGPAKIIVGGKTYSSKPVQIKVLPIPKISGGQQGPIFATATITPEKGYPGQEFIYGLTFYRSQRLSSLDLISFPDVSGLAMHEAGQARQFNVARNGQNYEAVEIVRIITASEPGAFNLPPAVFRAGVIEQRRYGIKKMNVSSNPVPFTVLPFPEQNRPADFNGLVGSFSARATLEPSTVKAGESATFTLTLTGHGNVRLMPDVVFPDIPGVKIYSDQPVFTEKVSDQGTRATKIMKWAIVPQVAENIPLPPFSISYFDPETSKYAVAATRQLTLEVLPGELADSRPEQINIPLATPIGQRVKTLGADILGIHEEPFTLSPGFPRAISPWLATLILIAPLLIFFGSAAAKRMSKKSKTQIRAKTAKKALGIFRKTIRNLEQALEIHKALQEYLAARLGMDAATLTAVETKEKLGEKNINPDLILELTSLFSLLETCVFSQGGGKFDNNAKQNLIKIIRKIDKKV